MDSSNIEDFLECSICLDQMDERSRVLPCQHTFCMKCLLIIVENKGHLQCPECRSSYHQLSVNELPRNVLLIRILEGLKTKRRSSEIKENTNVTVEKVKCSKRLSAKVKCDALLNQPAARGLYNFSSDEEGDLPFLKGDVITLLHEIDDNWLEGILKGKRGSIPKTFVEILVNLPKIDDDLIKIPFAKALYTYGNRDDLDLISFKEGDIIRVIKKVDDNWLEGILGGHYGIFPVNFMKLNKAAQDVMNNECNTSSSSSSDEENEIKKKKKSRSKREKKLSASPTERIKQQHQQLQLDPSSVSTSEQSKRHTIHVENPHEQSRQSRRALNLSDELDPQDRKRTQSQGRRASESATQERSLASSVLLTQALRNSDEQLTNSNSSIPVSTTTSVPTRSEVSLTFSTGSHSNTPSPLGPGETYTALFTYSPGQDDELALIQGDQYHVIEKHLDGWFKGVHIRSRQSGVFPGNYVKPSNQVSQQMLRNISSGPARSAIGYGSNPSSPTIIPNANSAFCFPVRSSDGLEACGATPRQNGECSSPSRTSGFGLFKKLKKSKSKQRPAPPSTPTTPTGNDQAPPSYYHSSMPGPAHCRLSRPSPMVPAEPPPPYTPVAPSTTPIIQTDVLPANTEKFRAIATYPASQDLELSLQVGDIIYVTRKHADGWYTGKSTRTGECGVFPSMFVESC